jgi:hypothetical protein
MNYLKVYCNLIRKAENRTPPEGYTEKHHTFPKSIFGKNNRIVILTSREHYIAHALLEKIYIKRYGLKDQKTIKMIYAHCVMKNSEDSYYNSYLYENAKRRMSDILSEVMKGRKLSKSTKQKLREKNIGDKNPMFGIRGDKHHFYGKNHTQETKNILSEKNIGDKNPFYGKHHTEEAIQVIIEKNKGKKRTQETRDNISKSKRGNKHFAFGKKWWNNGITNKLSLECPGEGWIRGMLHNKINKNKK